MLIVLNDFTNDVGSKSSPLFIRLQKEGPTDKFIWCELQGKVRRGVRR
jgi:hypothetical protein